MLLFPELMFAQNLLNNNKDNAKIDNKGVIRIRQAGNVLGMPDTIGGRVEFTADRKEQIQIVPNVTYNQLMVTGKTTRLADSIWTARGKNALRTLDSLLVLDSTLLVADTVEINAKASVKNISEIKGRRDVRLNGDTSNQTITGNGKFSNLNIDNTQGVDVINKGGFSISTKLELTRGELRNDSLNNFSLSDSAWIVRNVGGSIKNEPQFGKNISVKYVGTGSMLTGGELPTDTTKLSNMRVENTDGVTLSKSVTVNNELYLKSPIRTEPDTNSRYILTSTNASNPVFDSPDAEIDGSFRRTNLKFDDSKIIFNNPHTYASFKDTTSLNNIREMTFRVKPREFPPFYKGDIKVKRYLNVSAKDVNYQPLDAGFNFRIGYGWRYSLDTAKDETNGLPVPDLILQRWTGNDWFDITSSLVPQIDTLNEWAFSSADGINSLGDFAVGMPGHLLLTLNAKVLLEGPYRFGSMAMDLRFKNIIPTTPPDIYPYNLDPNRQFMAVKSIPDSVVDWIVLEFRPSFNSTTRFYRTVFVRTDGKVVDLDGKSPVMLSKGGVDTGEYFIAVRHRNHLAIITENRVSLYPETVQKIFDFTSPGNLMGRNNALKAVGFDPNGSVLWGMIAGDVNGDGYIDSGDLVKSWDDRDYEGYFSSDINMSGIINTRDLNFSWNNRGKSTFVP